MAGDTRPSGDPGGRGETPNAGAGEAPTLRSRLRGLHPVLLGAYPVLFLWTQNLGQSSIGEAVPPLVAMAGAAGLAGVLLGLVLRDVRRGALVVAPAVVALGLYGHLVSLLDGPPAANLSAAEDSVSEPAAASAVGWSANELLVAAVLAGVIVAAIVAAVRLGSRRIAMVDWALLRIAAILVAVTLLPITSHLVSSALEPSRSRVDPTLPTSTTALRRDVYWLVFDRYGSDRSLSLRFGIENDFTAWLEGHGFTVLADSHANYLRTALSLATTANMTHLEGLAGYAGAQSSSLAPVYAGLNGSLVARQFQALGYRYFHVGSWWAPTTKDTGADVNYNYADVSDFAETLVDSSAIPALAELVGADAAVPDRSRRHYDHGRYELEVLRDLRDEPGPKFVFAHVLLPHPPYVFNADGTFAPVDRGRGGVIEQLEFTNTALREILAPLLALPEDRRPIIVLQADEGPYPRPFNADLCCYDWSTATPDELEMKYGILNAWYVPGHAGLALYPSMTAINTFPVLFGGYFGIEYPSLPDRSFTSRDQAHQFDLTDITGRLPSLAP